MTSHERANEKFKKAYDSAANILSKSVGNPGNHSSDVKVYIQNLTDEELKKYKAQLKKQRAAINREERIRYIEEHKKEITGIIVFGSLLTAVSLSIFLYTNWKEKADYAMNHPDELISQYNNSAQFQEDDPRVGIVNWIDDLAANILNLNMDKGGK